MPKPWLLAELTYHDVRLNPPRVAVLPFGATEPHNLHLPYGTDVFETDAIAELACERAHRLGAKVVCLPAIPFGTETNQQGFPLAMNLQPSTLLAIVRDLVGTLERSGVHKLLILNGHGGNEFKWILRELFNQTTVQLFLCNWYTVHRERYHEVFRHADDHGGEMETSLVLHLRPELVFLDRADEGAVRTCRFQAVRQGHVLLTRPWDRLTKDSGVGDPRQATAEKGKRWLEIVVEPIANFLVELERAPIDDLFPFQ